jgi:hypothetical protein
MKLFKKCPDCGEDKPVSEFGRNAKLKDGLQFYCRACCARRGAEVYRRKRERMGKKVRPRINVPPGHKRCPGCERILPLSDWHRNSATRDGYADRCKSCRSERSKAQHVQKKFGISMAERDEMLEAQGGLCAICGGEKPAHTDHDHETGQLRGLLCIGCNLGLGQFRDDPSRLRAAARYLDLHRKPALRLVADQVYKSPESVFEVNLRKHLAS